jgi:Fic family protein
MATRSQPAAVAPSIPIPVKEIPQRPSLEERSRELETRIQRQTPEFRQRYLESFEMSWVYHDTALEGVVYTFEELMAAFRAEDLTVVDSSVMPIFEAIRRQKEAIDYVREAADKKRSVVSLDSLKKIYVILHPEEGDVKTVKYRRDVPQHRLYFHEYGAPDKIAYKVRQVIDWVNDPETKKSVGTLRTAAKVHYDLARIYPFTHDSGKVARMFMNMLLLRGDLPPAIIHSTERQRYYEALKASSAGPLLQMLRDSVDNALASIEKLLDEHETHTRGFVS